MEKRIILIGVILAAAASRILPHPPNIAPIAGIALFAGANLGFLPGLIISLSAMLLSDAVIGFHGTMLYVYGSFILIILLGRLLQNKQTPGRLFGMSLFSSILFFIITNFGVWAEGQLYAKNITGLQTVYVMGLPFLRNTMIGDMFYTFAIFYGYLGVVYIVKRFNYLLLGFKPLSR